MVNEMNKSINTNNLAFKKRVLFVVTKSVWGGAQKYVYDLAVNLSKKKFDVLVAAGGNGPLVEKLKESEILYYEIKKFKRDISFLSDILSFFEVLKLLRKTKPDIVHVNSSKAGGIAGIAILIYKMFFRNPYPKSYTLNTIFTVHGFAFNEARPKWQIFLIKLASRFTCVFYDKIICVSEYDRQAAIKNKTAPERKLVTIHNGIDIDEKVFLSKGEAIEKLEVKSQKFKVAVQNLKLENIIIIGTVGEFTKNKGHKYLIEAFKKLQTANYKLIIIGWGEDKQKLEEKIKELEMEDKVFLIEGLSPAMPYLKAFDIFVLPSLKEGLPYTLLEAGLARLPVVVSDVGGIPEIIENEKTGLLISPANVSALASAIKKILEDKNLRDKLAENFHKKIIQEFSLEKMIRETLRVYL